MERERVYFLGAAWGKRLCWSGRLIALGRQFEFQAGRGGVLIILADKLTLHNRLTVLIVARLAILQITVAAWTVQIDRRVLQRVCLLNRLRLLCIRLGQRGSLEKGV